MELRDQIREHLLARGYGRTWALADRFGTTTSHVRREMLKLERLGIVQRDERASAVNDICWKLAPAQPPGAET